MLESEAAAYQPGQILDDETQVALAEDEFIVVATEDGELHRVEGPHEGPVTGEPPSDAGVLRALARLLGIGGPEVGGLAGVRGDPDEETGEDTRPEPWILHADHAGDQCVLQGHAVELWREEAATAEVLELADVAADATVELQWPASEQRMQWPTSSPPEHGRVYLLRRAGSLQSIPIKVHAVPAASTQDRRAAVAWLAAHGCVRQARQLLDQMNRSAR